VQIQLVGGLGELVRDHRGHRVLRREERRRHLRVVADDHRHGHRFAERAAEAETLRLGLAEVEATAPEAGEDSTLLAEEEKLANADALHAAGFDDSAPAFFSWLGVVPYLERPAIDATFRFIAALPQGTAVVFDYAVPPETLSWAGRLIYRQMAKRVAAVGEPWKTFFDPKELMADLRRLGFTSAEDFDGDALNERYFKGRTDRLKVGGMGHMAMARV